MANKVKITNQQGTQVFPITHISAVLDDNGNSLDEIIKSSRPFKGWYDSSSALSVAWPSPETGDYAYVKDGQSTAYIYAESSGSWSNTNISVSVSDMDSAFPRTAKLTLLSVLKQVAWINPNGNTYLSTLQNVLMNGVVPSSVDAVFDSSAVVLDSDSLDDLRSHLTVTATFSDTSTAVVDDYELSGTIILGTSSITVNYMGVTDTVSVPVQKNYAGALDNWTPCYYSSAITYSDGILSIKCRNSSDVENWQIWAADIKKTLWSSVNGKTVKVRIKVENIEYASFGVGVYQNASTSSMSSSYTLRANLSLTQASDGYYEGTFVCNISNFTLGSLTPDSSSTFGVFCYSRSEAVTVRISDVQVFEIS